jgi:chorismate synthase
MRQGRVQGIAWHDGAMLRWITAGESHGPALVAVLEAWSPE